MNLLFVCTGNICRSPTAERLASAYASRDGIRGLTTSSAGTHAINGHPIHREASVVLKQLGGDSSGFKSRQLTYKSVLRADLIVGMSRAHRDAVLELAPDRIHRTFTLKEVACLVQDFGAERVADLRIWRSELSMHAGIDIVDPIGQPSNVFAAVGAQIAELLPPLLSLCRPVSE